MKLLTKTKRARVNLSVILLLSCIFVSSALADSLSDAPAGGVQKPSLESQNLSMFQNSLLEAQRLPSGAVAVKPAPVAVIKEFLGNFKSKTEFYHYHHGTLTDSSGQAVTLFKAAFNNSGKPVYLIVARSRGSLGVDSVVAAYQQVAPGKLLNLHFNRVVTRSLFPDGGDMSGFYLFMPKPMAYIYRGDVFMRYLSLPPASDRYDTAKIRVCTYVWQGDKFYSASPLPCIGNLKAPHMPESNMRNST